MFHRFVLTATACAALLPGAALAEPASSGANVFSGSGASTPGAVPTNGPLIIDLATTPERSSRPDDHWGEPLGADLVHSDKAKLGVRYFGEAGANGTTQAVGVKLTIPQ
ncbi:MAG: hypothetical protein JO348_06400 [Alphaproteobacteria bacterium]|nr:hypothetical protein [Alphaproteobacteria bacterium]MBV9419386.1 hypothetical protein [Alphaproteobacteria bacterium]